MAFNNYNSFLPNNQFYTPQYINPMNNMYQGYQPQNNMVRQPQPNVQQQYGPFSQIMYATLEEAKNYIVDPGQTILFIHRDKEAFSIKSADLTGKSVFESFKYSKFEGNEMKESQERIDTSVFVKQEDLATLLAEKLNGLLTKEDLKNFTTKEDVKSFVTKEDLKVFETKLDAIQKQVKINQILNEEKPIING